MSNCKQPVLNGSGNGKSASRRPVCGATNNSLQHLKRGPFINKAKSQDNSLAEFYGNLATGLWNEFGSKLVSIDVVSGIKDAFDPKADAETRIKGGLGITTGLATKYAFVAEKMGAYTMAKWLGAYVGGVGFLTTAWDIMSMMGKGYQAGHQIASAKGEQAGKLVGLTAAVAWGKSVNHRQHIYNSVKPDMIPGSFEVTHARAFNKGYFEGYNLFMRLPKEQAYEFQMAILDMMKNDALRDRALIRFFRHRKAFGDEAQGAQTNMVLPYVIFTLRVSTAK
jgi:hypothetical protein